MSPDVQHRELLQVFVSLPPCYGVLSFHVITAACCLSLITQLLTWPRFSTPAARSQHCDLEIDVISHLRYGRPYLREFLSCSSIDLYDRRRSLLTEMMGNILATGAFHIWVSN